MAAITTASVAGQPSASPILVPSVNQPPKTWTTFAMSLSTYEALSSNLASILSPSQNGDGSAASRADPTVETSKSQQTRASIQSTQDRPIGETYSGSEHQPHYSSAASDSRSLMTASNKILTHLTDTKMVLGSVTLILGETMTLGSGRSATTVSLVEHGGSPTVAPDATHTTLFHPTQGTETVRLASSLAQPTISRDYRGDWIVNGETFAPGSVITLKEEGHVATFSMLTSVGRTFVAVDTSTTVPLGAKSSTTPPLALTRASNGNFVLSGTTLEPGKPVTIGQAGAETTLEVTSVNSTPAIVLDGTATDLLGVATLSSDIASSSATSLPITTRASTPGNTQSMPAGGTGSSLTTSGCEHPSAEIVSMLLIAILIFAIQAAH